MDIERVVALRLMAATGIKCVLDVPADRPEEFACVTLSPRVAVTCWAATRRRALEMAEAVERACGAIEDEPNVFQALPDGLYRWDDPETGTPRYQTNIDIKTCE